MTYLLTGVVFGLAIAGLSMGIIISNTPLRGSCGGAGDEEDDGCGVCQRKAVEICPTNDELVQIAQVMNPDPKHHR